MTMAILHNKCGHKVISESYSILSSLKGDMGRKDGLAIGSMGTDV